MYKHRMHHILRICRSSAIVRSNRTKYACYDPTIYRGTAAYYTRGRPPYARTLAATLAAELGLDGGGSLLDVGCGPGVLAVELADRFSQVIGLDPDAEMLAEGARRAAEAGITNIRWVQARGEDIPTLDLGTFKLVTFGQSFHWTEPRAGGRSRVRHPRARRRAGADQPRARGSPAASRPWPPADSRTRPSARSSSATLARAAAPARASRRASEERYEDTLARTRFGAPRRLFAPGRPDIVRNIDDVLANYFSMSYAAPHLFGDRRARVRGRCPRRARAAFSERPVLGLAGRHRDLAGRQVNEPRTENRRT